MIPTRILIKAEKLCVPNLKIFFKVYRHGQRTPADTYPNDPYVNETFYPYGWGQMTNVRAKI